LGRINELYEDSTMNRQEAREILAQQLARWKKLGYAEIKSRCQKQPREDGESVGADGIHYTWHVKVGFADTARKSELRFFASLSSGTLRSSFFPITSEFVIRQDGTCFGD
jgi:hypothetical protein